MNKRRLIAVSSLAFSLIFVFFFFRYTNANTNEDSISTTTVKRDDISSFLTFEGKIESNNISIISSELDMSVAEVLVKEGDKVSCGDVLAVLSTDKLKDEIENDKKELEIEKMQYEEKYSDAIITSMKKDIDMQLVQCESLKRRLESSKELYESGSLSKDELNNSELEYNKSSMALEKMNIELEKLKSLKNNDSGSKMIELKSDKLNLKISDVKRANITSDIDGTVTKVSAKKGTDSNSAGGLFTVEDLSDLKVSFEISEYDVEQIEIGKEIEIVSNSNKSKKYNGTISFISPIAHLKEGTTSGKQVVIDVEANLHGDTSGIRAGQYVKGSIETVNAQSAFIVPYESVYETPDKKNCVFVLKNGELEKVYVTLGIEGDLAVQVISEDLNEGDIIARCPDETFFTKTEID